MNHIKPPTYIIILSLLITLSACGRVEKVEDADTDGDGPCTAGLTLCGDECVDTDTDERNCGACGHLCQNAPHGTGICAGGECDLDCDEGYWNHDDDLVNGCEYDCDISGEGNEICNGIDDDCDGVIDNFEVGSCPMGQVVSCETECGSEGTTRCNDLCRPGDCIPPDETCNGIDDDCDGAADNGFDCVRGSTVACETSCGSTGTGTCNPDCTLPAPAGCQVPDEVCNWIDDDCNGEIDDGTEFGVIPGTAKAITDGAFETGSTIIAFGSTNYVIAWEDDRNGHPSELYTRAVALDGSDVSADVQLISNESSEYLGDIVWNGSEFGIAYHSNYISPTSTNEVWIVTLDESAGQKNKHNIIVELYEQENASLIWDESVWGIAWLDSRIVSTSHNIFFAQANTVDLTIIDDSENTVSTSMSYPTYPDIAWSGSQYAIVWNQNHGTNRKLYFRTLDPDGTPDPLIVPVTEDFKTTSNASIVWTSSQWVVAWPGEKNDGTEGYFMALLEEDGVPLMPYVIVEEADVDPDVVKSPFRITNAEGSGIGAIWYKAVAPGRVDVVFQRFSYDLEPIGSSVTVSSSGVSFDPALAWDGEGFGLVWVNRIIESGFSPAVNFARVGCL